LSESLLVVSPAWGSGHSAGKPGALQTLRAVGYKLAWVGGFAALCWTAEGVEILAGGDFSLLSFFESRNIAYKDSGQAGNALIFLQRHGINTVRLRLFTSSATQAQADPYNYINNLDYTLPLAARVKKAGLRLMLDFHYSDTWADPGHQRKPNAWTNLNFSRLVEQMRSYNSNCIAVLKSGGAMPDYVQVGNEITGGLLWPDGRVGGNYDNSTQWSQLGLVLNAAIQGIKDASGTVSPKIIIHIDRGGDWAGTQWFFDNLRRQQVPFDIIGESYYPFWHGQLASLAHCLTNAALRYQKPVVIAETAFPWTNSVWTTNIVGLAGNPEGQVRFIAELASIVNRLPAGLGAGIVWWGAEYQQTPGVNEAGFNTTSFFDAQGNLLSVADALAGMALGLRLSASSNGSALSLSWPMSGAGLSLTWATNLGPSANWLPVANASQTNKAGFNVSVPLFSPGHRFFQLHSY
jgi:arabinogalactan endo-1,4-beta-galactosidase